MITLKTFNVVYPVHDHEKYNVIEVILLKTLCPGVFETMISVICDLSRPQFVHDIAIVRRVFLLDVYVFVHYDQRSIIQSLIGKCDLKTTTWKCINIFQSVVI